MGNPESRMKENSQNKSEDSNNMIDKELKDKENNMKFNYFDTYLDNEINNNNFKFSNILCQVIWIH